MSEETKVSERTAIRDGFEEEVRIMYRNFLDALVQENADVEQACRHFKRGLGLAKKALELANNMISE